MKTKKPIGIQLYTVRDHLENDYFGTLEKVAEIGYNTVEFAGYYGKTAEEIRKKLDELKLTCISSHQNYDVLVNDLDSVIESHKILGCKYIAVPWAGDDERPGGKNFDEAVKNYTKIGEKLLDNGIELLYHNHDFEFVDYNGMLAYDYMFDTIPKNLFNPEMDVCWVKFTGYDPAEYIKKYNGRMKVLHVKDFFKANANKESSPYALMDNSGKDGNIAIQNENDTFEFRPVGYGIQDMNKIISTAEECNMEYYIVEQDNCNNIDSFTAAKMSYDKLSELLKA